MKKVFRTVALIALMGLTATGCQKESMVEQQNSIADISFKSVYYTIDGMTTQASYDMERPLKVECKWE